MSYLWLFNDYWSFYWTVAWTTEGAIKFLHLIAPSVVWCYKSKIELKLDLNLQPADLSGRFLRSLLDGSPRPSFKVTCSCWPQSWSQSKSRFSSHYLVDVISSWPRAGVQRSSVPEAAELDRVLPPWEHTPKQRRSNPIGPETGLPNLSPAFGSLEGSVVFPRTIASEFRAATSEAISAEFQRSTGPLHGTKYQNTAFTWVRGFE